MRTAADIVDLKDGALRERIEKGYEVGASTTGPLSVTNEPYQEMMGIGGAEGAFAAFREYAKNKKGKLYWRCTPEVVVSGKERGKWYMRLLISDKPLADPARQEIIKEVGDISQVEVMHNYVLVGIWIKPAISKGGLHLPDQYRDEDKYQGKTGLVLKKGPTAFVDGPDGDFMGQNVEIGDWIVLRPGDGWQVRINGRDCRMVPDVSIKLKVPKPDMIY